MDIAPVILKRNKFRNIVKIVKNPNKVEASAKIILHSDIFIELFPMKARIIGKKIKLDKIPSAPTSSRKDLTLNGRIVLLNLLFFILGFLYTIDWTI